MAKHVRKPSGEGGVAKEYLIGLLAVLWGGYNLLFALKIIDLDVMSGFVGAATIQIIGNILLILAGFLLWATAYKLWRVRWHTRGIL